MVSLSQFLTEKIENKKLVPKRKLSAVGPTVLNIAKHTNPSLSAYTRKQGLHHAGWGVYENKEGKPVAYADPKSPSRLATYEPEHYGWHPLDKHIEKQFNHIENHASKVHEALKDFRPELDEDEKRSLDHYTGIGYDHINSSLYKNLHLDENTKGHVENLKNLIDENRAPFDYTTYTGLSRRYSPKNLKKGGKYIFHGFLSSSLSPQIAGSFIGNSGKDSSEPPVMIQLNVKRGQKATYVGHDSRHDKEKETLMPPKTKIRIVSGPHVLADVPSIHKFINRQAQHENPTVNKFLNARNERGPFTHYYVAELHDGHEDEDLEDTKSLEDRQFDRLNTPTRPGSRAPEKNTNSMKLAAKYYHGVPDNFSGNRDYSFSPEKTPETKDGNIVPKKKFSWYDD